MKSGLWITFEGMDGSGKSTQLALCAQALETDGFSIVQTRNPGGTPFGQQLREILLHSEQAPFPMSELFLFMADRAQHLEEVVLPALEAGQIILCDRHMDSTMAYQGYGRGLSLDIIQTLNNIATQKTKPDCTFLLDGDPIVLSKRASQRGKADRIEAETSDFHRRVRDGYLKVAQADPQRIVLLNAELDQVDLHWQIMTHLKKMMGHKQKYLSSTEELCEDICLPENA